MTPVTNDAEKGCQKPGPNNEEVGGRFDKHFFIWIGFFTGIMTSIPFLLGAWGVAQDYYKQIVGFSFGALTVVILSFLLLLKFKDPIFRRLGLVEVSLAQVSGLAIEAVGLVAKNDLDGATDKAKEFTKTALGWWSWVGLYRWVIRTAITLVLAIGAFAGTVLLFQQNQHLNDQSLALVWQNELIAADAVSKIREHLFLAPGRLNSFPSLDVDDCRIGWDDAISLHPHPNPSVVRLVSGMAENPDLFANVIRALEALLLDDSGTVALGALIVLDKLNAIGQSPISRDRVRLTAVDVSDLTLKSSIELELVNSRMRNFRCPECNVILRSSYVHGGTVAESVTLDRTWMRLEEGDGKIVGQNSSIIDFRKSGSFSLENMLEKNLFLGSSTELTDVFEFKVKSEFNQVEKAVCSDVEKFCQENHLLECKL